MTSQINDLIAAQLSDAAYGTVAPPLGWRALAPPFVVGVDSFTIYTNDSNQIVFAFKGTNTWTQIYQDVTDQGGPDWENIKQTFCSELQVIQASYPGYQIFTDGHSLGGGMAQSAALEYNLSGYGQNSLPISPAAISDRGIVNVGGITSALTTWVQGGYTFRETTVSSDITTLYYGNNLNLYTSPITKENTVTTILPNVYAAAEVDAAIDIAVAGESVIGAFVGVAELAAAEYEAHSIGNVITSLQQNSNLTGDTSAITTQDAAISTADLAATQNESISASQNGNLIATGQNNNQVVISLQSATSNSDTYNISVGGVPNQVVVVTTNADNSVTVNTQIQAGATVEISADNNSSGLRQIVTFTDNNETFHIDPQVSFSGTILNLVPGDTVDVGGVSTTTNPTLGAGNVLTVQNNSGSVVTLNLDPSTDFSGQKFVAISDGNGGTNISLGATFNIIGNGTRATPEIPIVVGDTVTIAAFGTINVGNLLPGVNALQTPAGQSGPFGPDTGGLLLVDPNLTPFSLIGSVGGYNDFEIGPGVSTVIQGPPGEVGEFQMAFNALAIQEVIDLVAFDYPYTNYFQVGTESDQFEAGTSGSWQVTVSITNGGAVTSGGNPTGPSWNNSGGGDWGTPSNWSNGALPSAADNVTIDTPSMQTVTHDSGDDTVNDLTVGDDNLDLNGGSLTVTSNSTFGSGQVAVTGATLNLGPAPVTIASLNLQSTGGVLDTVQAKLDGSGTITVTGAATIGNAILTGPGELLLEGTTTLDAGSIEYLGESFAVDSGYTLANAGLFELNGGELDDGYVSTLGGNGGGTIENLAGATFDISNGNITSIGGAFTNAGLLQVNAVTGQAGVAAPLYNTGTVAVTAGTLSLGGGGLSSNSAFSVAVTAGIAFDAGTFTFAGGAPVAIAGALTVDEGALQLSASNLTVGSLTISNGGTLGGSGVVAVSGLATLARGLQAGTGTTELMSTTTVTGETDLGGGRVLQNYGTLSWTDPEDGLIVCGVGAAGGTLENMSGATINLQSDGGQIGVRSGAASFTNAGTITQTLVTGQTDIQPVFVNTGVVNIQAGTLSFDGGGSSSASAINVAVGAALSFEDNNSNPSAFTFTGGTLNLAGALRIENGIVDASGVAIASIGSSLSVDGVSGTLEAGGQNFSVARFEEGTGSFVGTGTFTVTGSATFDSGDGQALQAGPGLTVLLGASTVTSELALDNDRTIENTGNFSWQSGNIDLGRNFNAASLGDGTIDNASGGVFDITQAGQIVAYSGTDTFINAGTLQQRHTSGQTIIRAAFANTGTVVVQSGTLEFDANGSSSASAYAVMMGASLEFGDFANNGGSVAITGGAFSLAGALVIASGTLEFGSNSMTISAASAILDGSIDGTGTLTVAAPTMITAFGIETGRGVTILENTIIDAPGDLDNSGGFVINGGRDVKNVGTIVWNGGTIGLDRVQYGSGSGGGTLENLSGSTIDVETNDGMYEGNGTAIFANAGLVQQFGVTGTSEIRTQVTNTGTVNVMSGGMFFSDSLMNDGMLQLSSSSISIAKTLTGDRGSSGSVTIGTQGTLWLQAGAAMAQTVNFAAPDATLRLSQPANVAASLTGVQPGDIIELVGVAADTASYSGNVLSISNGGSLVANLNVSGAASVRGFQVTSSNGNTDLVAATTASPAGSGTGTVQGADGVTRSVLFGSTVLATLAAPLLAGIAPANTLFVDAGGSTAMSGAQTAAIDDASGPVTLVGNGAANEIIAAGAGAFAFQGGSGSGTLVAGAGADSIYLPGGGNWNVALGNGADTVVAATGNNTVSTGTAGSFVFLGSGTASVASAGADTILGSSGAATVSAADSASDEVFALGGPLQFIAGTGASTVVSGAVSATLFGGSTGTLMFGDGATQVLGGSGADTVVGLGGSLSVQGGAGGGLFFGGTAGGNVITAGSGNAIAFGGGAGDVLTATGSASDLFAGGVGAETLTGAGSTGSNTFFAGFGPETLIGGAGNTALVAGAGMDQLTGGSGLTLFLFVNGRTSGAADTISGFDPTHDFVKLAGYSGDEGTTVNNATLSNGSSTIALSDGTQITFAGVSHLSVASFT